MDDEGRADTVEEHQDEPALPSSEDLDAVEAELDRVDAELERLDLEER